MHLSYSTGVIKAESAATQGKRLISTDERAYYFKETDETKELKNTYVESYERIAQGILNKAKTIREDIITKAYKEAAEIEKSAYEKGYDHGKSNGYEDGYRESYDANIEKGKKDAAELVRQGEDLLLSAKNAYENYLRDKEQEMVRLSITIAENIIRESLEGSEGLNHLILEALESSKRSTSYIIKANSVHIDTLEREIESWRSKLALKGEIILLEDNSLQPGNTVITTEKGRVEVGVDTALKKIAETLAI